MVLIRPLANWKTRWGGDLANKIGMSLKSHVDASKLPGRGCLLDIGETLTHSQFQEDSHLSFVCEAVLKAYPKERLGSAYLLGDAVLHLDAEWNHSLLGQPSNNPMQEKARRDRALREGAKLKKVLSYVRSSAYRNELAKCSGLAYLKKLANERKGARTSFSRSSSSRSLSPSIATPSSTEKLLDQTHIS